MYFRERQWEEKQDFLLEPVKEAVEQKPHGNAESEASLKGMRILAKKAAEGEKITHIGRDASRH